MKKLNKLGVVLLASGLLLTACAKSGNSSNSSSTSSKLTASEQKQLKQATSDYKTFVEGEIDQLLKDTEGFSETLKSGNLEEAKKQYPLVRMAYERSEPIAESFGESDVKIDYRLVDYMDENKSEDGWSGFHVLNVSCGKTTRPMEQLPMQINWSTISRNSRLKLQLLKSLQISC